MRNLTPRFEYTEMNDYWQNVLAGIREHGMGYSYVHVRLKDGTVHRNVVAVGCRTLLHITVQADDIMTIVEATL